MYFAKALSDQGIAEIYKHHGPEDETPETEAATEKVLALLKSMEGRADYGEVETTIFQYAGEHERYGFIAGFKMALKLQDYIMAQEDGPRMDEECKRALLEYEAGRKVAKGEAVN